jgi:NAD(P)-dependent dehydrogenase (short-subunit alcohol dehydrogenase family)
VTITNTADGADYVREIFGDDVVVIPYVRPGFELARDAAAAWPDQAHTGTVGLVLLQHGLFSIGETAEEAYACHVDLLERAARWLDTRTPASRPAPPPVTAPVVEIARLRHALSDAAGRSMIVRPLASEATRRFAARSDVAEIATRGPTTPDHVIRTKRVPMIGRDVDKYVREYTSYFDEYAQPGLVMLDPAPRVVIDSELGVLAVGENAGAAQVVADLYSHTIPVIETAEDGLGGYVALSPRDIFGVEYWELEQAKLRASGTPPRLAGSVAVVTGAASGIGRACADFLLRAGAAVVGVDVASGVERAFEGNAWRGVVADVTDESATERAVRSAVEAFGGIDIAVLAAGVFGPSTSIADLPGSEWDDVFSINARSAASLLRQLYPFLKLAPLGGRVAVVASKNVPAPGRAAAAYSASKAALTQLCRVAALEWAGDGIRVNMVHPDAVFDTGLWTPELIAERAARYGLSPEEYKRRNLLGVEITSHDVAAAVVALCSDAFRATTGAQVPVDGGSDRVI